MTAKFPILVTISLAALTASNLVTAAPLVSIGDTANIHFIGAATTYYTSNLFRDETGEIDDVVLSIMPGLELSSVSGASNASFGATARYTIRRYDDRNELNTELLSLNAYGRYETARLVLNAKAGFSESQTNTGAANVVGSLIESELTTASINGEYRLSPKFKFGAGANYSMKDYVTFEDAVSDNNVLSLPFDLFYELTPKLDVSAGFTYSDKEVEDRAGATGYDSETYFYNVGLRGDLLPKLNGFVKVGYRNRERDGVDDQSTLGLDANLTWAATPKLTNRLIASRDFGIAGDGSSTERTSFRVTSSYSITSQYQASANLGYVLREYLDASSREDDLYSAGISLSYVPNQYWRFSTGYTYTDNQSSEAGQSYENNRVELSASLRY